MGISNKPGAIGKPRLDLPIHLLTVKLLRLWDDAGLACRDELEADSVRVTVCQVFAIGRNCPGHNPILKRIVCELPQLQLTGRLHGTRPRTAEPENCAGDQ
jgi:hypothetical protein